MRETVPADTHPLLGLLDGEDVEALRPLLEAKERDIVLEGKRESEKGLEREREKESGMEKESGRETVPAETHPLLGLLDREEVEGIHPLLEVKEKDIVREGKRVREKESERERKREKDGERDSEGDSTCRDSSASWPSGSGGR